MKRRYVTVQVETFLPRVYVRGGFAHETIRRYPTQVELGRWPVLYVDREVIVVRQFGSVSLYERTTGRMIIAGYNKKHVKARLVPERHGWWRIAPASLIALKETLTRRAS